MGWAILIIFAGYCVYLTVKGIRSARRSETIEKQANLSTPRETTVPGNSARPHEEQNTDLFAVLKNIVHYSAIIEKQYYKKLYDLQKPRECNFVAGLSAILSARVANINSKDINEDVAAVFSSESFEQILRGEFANEFEVIPFRKVNDKTINIPLDLFLASSNGQIGSFGPANACINAITYIAWEMFCITYAKQDINTLSHRLRDNAILRETFDKFFETLFECVAEGEHLCQKNRILFPSANNKIKIGSATGNNECDCQGDIVEEETAITPDSCSAEPTDKPLKGTLEVSQEELQLFLSNDNNMKFCRYCGKQIDMDSAFCKFCGKPL